MKTKFCTVKNLDLTAESKRGYGDCLWLLGKNAPAKRVGYNTSKPE